MAEHNEIPESVLREFYTNGNYEVIKSLGYGAYGQVFLVKDKMLNMDVAAKVVATSTANEQKIWPTLNHPNILTHIRTDYIISDAVAFITPYEGHDLFYMLYEKKPDFHADKLCFVHKRKYMLDVLKGLEYLHGRNLCHLDLREENILIRPCHMAIIGDFSTLVYSEQVQDTQFGLNSKALPPEVINREQSVSDFDGMAAEMWTYGYLVLQVFTKQFIMRHTPVEVTHEDYLPKVLQATKNPRLLALFDEQHRETHVSEADKNAFINFVETLIVKEPKCRSSAKVAMGHPFMEGAETQISLREDLDNLIKQEFDSTGKRKAVYNYINRIPKIRTTTSKVDFKCINCTRNFVSLESISPPQKKSEHQENSPERTRTLPKNFVVLSDSNFSPESKLQEPQIETAFQEMSIASNLVKNRPTEKSILTTFNFYNSTGGVSQAVFDNQIGDGMPQTSSAKWTDSFVKLFAKPKSKRFKGIENPFYDNAVMDESVGVEFTAKGQVCEKPKRQWYWRLRAFGRMFSKGKLFKKRQKKDTVREDKQNLM